MSRIIYNEGRVVGLSAYEIFVKHALAAGIDPSEIPSEQTWLAASIGMGASLILYIPAGTSAITDLALPSDSTLAAANTIIGSFFNGTGDYDSDGWVTNITSYGTNDANNVPQPTTPNQNALTDYLKIVDGNVNQVGVASVRTSNTLKPDLTSTGSATISITFSTATANGFYLQLTGFTDKSVLTGVVGIDGNQQNTDNPQNGDFIGPEVFPWSTKIVFTVPTSVIGAAIKQEVVDFPDSTIGYALKTKIGSIERKSISLSDISGNDLSVTAGTTPSIDGGNVAAESNDTLSWKALLYALKNNKAISLIGSVLKDLRSHLHYLNSKFQIGGAYDTQDFEVFGNITSNGNITANGDAGATGKIFSGYTIGNIGNDIVNFNYIIIDNAGTRLYISGSEPNGSIPDGSIGIGW